jgi:cell division protein ZapE
MTIEGPLDFYRSRIAAEKVLPDPGQVKVVERLQILHEDLRSCVPTGPAFRALLRRTLRLRQQANPIRGLYIYGPPGRGKSMLMDLFYDNCPVERRRRVHVHTFMQGVHARLHDWRQEGDGKQLEEPLPRLAREIAGEVSLLCFDEFQIEAIADAMIMRRLFEGLFENGVTVVATSNTAPDDLYAGGLHRDRFLPFIELLKDRLDVLELAGKRDYRRDRLTSIGVYHAPLNGESRLALDAAFLDLTDGAEACPGTLIVQGRNLAVPAEARGVARFSFSDLCEAALGSADYWAIACRYQTVILSDIPRLGPDDRNAAKRFAILIETLYEQKTKLICSAEVEPDLLYPEGDGASLFQRVASRLEEMRSEDYLSAPHRPANASAAA